MVIIGAGKTGRGFIGRLVASAGDKVVFIDRSSQLVEALAKTGAYNVCFFGGLRDPVTIKGFSAVQAGSDAAAQAISEADGVIVSVGASNFGSVADDIAKGLSLRASAGNDRPVHVVTAENAIAPAMKLRDLILGAAARLGLDAAKVSATVSEGAVFCTSDGMEGDQFGLISEDLDYFPFDAALAGDVFEGIPGFFPERDFTRVLTRKIYTYNCASACISYIGHLLGYSSYPEAANDPLIFGYLRILYEETGRALCQEYGFTQENQADFARASLRKFQNRDIADSIERNARDVARKLQRDERIVGPALLMAKQGYSSKSLPVVYACALMYMDHENDAAGELLQSRGPRGILETLSGMDGSTLFADSAERWYFSLSEARTKGPESIRRLLERGIE